MQMVAKSRHGKLANVANIRVVDNRGINRVADKRRINGVCLPPNIFSLNAKGKSSDFSGALMPKYCCLNSVEKDQFRVSSVILQQEKQKKSV